FSQEPLNDVDRFDGEDIRRNQPEHAAHACVRGDGVNAHRHSVEEWAAFFGTQKLEAQTVRLQRQRIDHFRACYGIVIEVFSGLVEELAGQRDVLIVHQIDLAQIRDVGNAAAVAGRDDAGDDPLKAARDV